MTYGCVLQKDATICSVVAMLTCPASDCQVLAKTTERFKEKAVDNEPYTYLTLCFTVSLPAQRNV